MNEIKVKGGRIIGLIKESMPEPIVEESKEVTTEVVDTASVEKPKSKTTKKK